MSAATAASRDRAVAAEEQNAPVAALDHWLDQRARQMERAVEHHTPDQLPIRIGRFSERLVRPDRSIVDQDVDPAKLGQRPGSQRLDLGLFADIREYSDRFDTKIPGLTRDGLSLLLIGARMSWSTRAPISRRLRPSRVRPGILVSKRSLYSRMSAKRPRSRRWPPGRCPSLAG